MKRRLILCMLAVMALQVGCASVATNRYYQATNPMRIRATESGAMMAVDLFDLGTVRSHPWATLGAAAVDAGMMLGVYSVGEKNDWWGSSGKSIQATANVIDIRGDGNTIIFNEPQEGETP